jgi:acetyl-CoA carboxylase carboxyltransferase component
MAKINIEHSKNEDEMKLSISAMKRRLEKINLGGGEKKLDKQRAKGKMTARERVAALIDKDSYFMEMGAFAAYKMYEEHGGCPAAGVIIGLAPINNRLTVIVANDASVKAGAWFPMTCKKTLRAQEVAIENKLPIVYLVDSAGVYLPLQNEVFADKEHFGRTFRNNAVMSSMGIPQVSAIMGSCVAGGAYLPIMSDEALIVEGTGSIFLAGPYLVKAAIGENVDKETLGGAHTQTAISGDVDYKCENDQECIDTIRDLFSNLGTRETAGFDRIESKDPEYNIDSLYQNFPSDRAKPYNTRELLKSLIDEGQWTEYKKEYGQTIICGYARIDGWSVGIVVNNREVVKTAKKEMQFGGVIYSDSADKAARFIMNCNQKKIPLVFLHDVSGFMVGSRSEHGGIIKDGAKMVSAVSNSTVPKISIIMGNSYGAGNYAMCGKAYDPRFIFSWPSGRIAVMGGKQAAQVLMQIQVGSMKAKGKEPTEKEQQEIFDRISAKYEEETSPYYAAARLWTDGIIDPADTRRIISRSIEAANHAPVEKFNVGVIQT